jgi:hypothetical protein
VTDESQVIETAGGAWRAVQGNTALIHLRRFSFVFLGLSGLPVGQPLLLFI